MCRSGSFIFITVTVVCVAGIAGVGVSHWALGGCLGLIVRHWTLAHHFLAGHQAQRALPGSCIGIAGIRISSADPGSSYSSAVAQHWTLASQFRELIHGVTGESLAGGYILTDHRRAALLARTA